MPRPVEVAGRGASAPRPARPSPPHCRSGGTPIAATVDYNRTSSDGKDCAARLDAQQKAIDALKAFGARLAAYDMQARLAQVKDDATAYAARSLAGGAEGQPGAEGQEEEVDAPASAEAGPGRRPRSGH